MIRNPRYPLPLLVFFLIFPLFATGNPAFSGSWTVDPETSSALDPWSRILLQIKVEGDSVTIERTVSGGRRSSTHVRNLRIGEQVSVPVEWWTGNRHIGAYIGGDGTESVSAVWLDDGRTLQLDSRYILATSQGETPVRSHIEYRLSPDGTRLTIIELRSSRDRPIVHVFNRS